MRMSIVLLTLFMASVATGEEINAGGIDLEDYRGQVVMVDFWASWCVPCRRSFPWMDEMQAKYREQGLVILAVNEDDEWVEAERFLDEYPISFAIVRDNDGVIAKQFDVQAMPSSYLFDRDGELVQRHFGFKVRQQQDYENQIQTTLQAEPQS